MVYLGNYYLTEIVLDLIILALFSSTFATFIKMCLRSGMIFGVYGNALRDSLFKSFDIYRKYSGNHETLDCLRAINKSPSRYARVFRFKRWLYKPLGLCIYCNGTWIGLGVYFSFMQFTLNIKELVLLFGFLGLNFLFMMSIKKLYDSIFTAHYVEKTIL